VKKFHVGVEQGDKEQEIRGFEDLKELSPANIKCLSMEKTNLTNTKKVISHYCQSPQSGH
jgi:hypothetical protein